MKMLEENIGVALFSLTKMNQRQSQQAAGLRAALQKIVDEGYDDWSIQVAAEALRKEER